METSVAYNQNASNADPWFNGTMMSNYRTFTTGIDSLSVQRVALANLRLSYLNTITLFSWNVYVGWTRSTSDHYLNARLYALCSSVERPHENYLEHGTVMS